MRDLAKHACTLADIVGLDMYYKVFVTRQFSKSFYMGPRDSSEEIRKHLSQHKKPLWITELQAEPWEHNHKAYLSENPGSINPERLQKNVAEVTIMQPEAIFLWGSEYWLWKKNQGDDNMWRTVTNIIQPL